MCREMESAYKDSVCVCRDKDRECVEIESACKVVGGGMCVWRERERERERDGKCVQRDRRSVF